MSQKKKKCAYRYTFSRPDKKDVDTREIDTRYIEMGMLLKKARFGAGHRPNTTEKHP